MGLLHALSFDLTFTGIGLVMLGVIVVPLLLHIVYTQWFHPLAKFPGPWYATSFSVVGALISVKQKEPQFLSYLVKKYGTDRPIRILPNVLLFPRPAAVKEIYWEAECNTKGAFYGSGALGPPSLFTTLDGEVHRKLRKALSNAPWIIGKLKNAWEARFDAQVELFTRKMREHAQAQRAVCISDKCAEFAADIMSMITFGHAFGCVKNQRDEKLILTNWRQGLDFFGFAGRCSFFRDRILALPYVGSWFLPSTQNESGMGWLMCEADRQVTAREKMIAEKGFEGEPDFLQHCLTARYSGGVPLTPVEKRAHITLLIQAGADTTGTALGSILRFISISPTAWARVRAEIDEADRAGHLSSPVLYEETRRHLPYFVACIKEGLRLHPPAPNFFVRIAPRGGIVLDGHFIPAGTEVMSYAYVMQRDQDFFGEDADEFRPERWLEDEKKSLEMEAVQFTFGMGPRVCIGKDIAYMEMFKLLPEIVRRFDVEVQQEGEFVVAGGIAYNRDFIGRFVERNEKKERSG